MNSHRINFENSLDQYSIKILWMITNENEKLNSLSFRSILDLASSFKVNTAIINDQKQLIMKVKQKIIDIIFLEKDQSLHYLDLPKFAAMPKQVLQILKQIVKEVLEEFKKAQRSTQNQEKYSIFFCSSKQPKDIQHFHMNLFEFFKTNFFFGQIGNYVKPPFFEHPYLHRPPNQDNSEGFQPFTPFKSLDEHFLTNKDVKSDKIMKESYSPFYKQSLGVKIEESIEEEYLNTVQNRESSGIKTPKPKIPRLTKQIPTTPSTPLHKQYKNCICRGATAPNQTDFTCSKCSNKYHLSCLKVPQYLHILPIKPKQCPLCVLKCLNFCQQIMGEPLDAFWVESAKEIQKNKIAIPSARSAEILKNKYMISLRWINFSPREYFQFQGHHKSAVSKVKIFEKILKLENFYNEKNQQAVIILKGLKSNRESSENLEGKQLWFMAALAFRIMKYEELCQKKYEYFDEGYLNRIFQKTENSEKESIRIEVMDFEDNLIKDPVRGNACQHAEICSLKEFLKGSSFDQNQTLDTSCIVCRKKYRNIKIDKKIELELNKIRSTISDPQQYPRCIYYHRDGSFSWEQPCNSSKQNNNSDGEPDWQV